MISTQDLSKLPDWKTLQSVCKSIAVLDAIISQDWEYRYYSYNSKWAEDEEFFEMRNGEGDQMLILFREDGCVINGFAHEFYDYEEKLPAKEGLTKGMPDIFNEFIYGEPVNSIGTMFCIWSANTNGWQKAELENFEDGSEDMLYIFDGNPQTYIDWATDYFEDSYNEDGIPLETVKKIYRGETLTREMVLTIVEDIEDWQQLESDFEEIGHPFKF